MPFYFYGLLLEILSIINDEGEENERSIDMFKAWRTFSEHALIFFKRNSYNDKKLVLGKRNG